MRGDLYKKPEGIFYAKELSEIFKIPISHIQILANMMKVKKDGANLYYFNQKHIDRIKRFLQNE